MAMVMRSVPSELPQHLQLNAAVVQENYAAMRGQVMAYYHAKKQLAVPNPMEVDAAKSVPAKCSSSGSAVRIPVRQDRLMDPGQRLQQRRARR